MPCSHPAHVPGREYAWSGSLRRPTIPRLGTGAKCDTTQELCHQPVVKEEEESGRHLRPTLLSPCVESPLFLALPSLMVDHSTLTDAAASPLGLL